MAARLRRSLRLRNRAVLGAALLAILAPAAVASAARGYNAGDFKLQVVSSSLGAPEQSSLELAGTISSRAYTAGLRANVHFVLTVKVTCAPASDPSQATTSTIPVDSQTGGFARQRVAYDTRPGGKLGWVDTITFPAVPFDDPAAAAWCPSTGAPEVLEGFSLVEAQGIAWLAQPLLSPVPGTTVYSYDVGAGSTVQKPHPVGP